MKTMTVIFNEPLHHVCLMYGVKQTFERMPFLNRKVLEIKGKTVLSDNVVAPPPVMRNPQRVSRSRMRNMVTVTYWKERLSVEYREDQCSPEEISAFTQALIQDYLHFRHPFMKTSFHENRCQEDATEHLIAEIQDHTVSL